MSSPIDRYAAEHDLGEPVARWQPDAPERIAKRAKVLAVKTAIAAALAGTALALLPWEEKWEGIVGIGGGMLGTLWLVLSLVEGIGLLAQRHRRFRRTLLYDNGVVFTDGDRILDAYDLRTASVTVRRVRHTGRHNGLEIVVTITDAGRERVVRTTSPTHRQYVDEFATRIGATATRAKAPVALNRIAAGETLDFGTVTLTPVGFRAGDGAEAIPYREYRSHDVVQGRLRIVFGDPNALLEVSLADTRDADVALTLIRALAAAS